MHFKPSRTARPTHPYTPSSIHLFLSLSLSLLYFAFIPSPPPPTLCHDTLIQALSPPSHAYTNSPKPSLNTQDQRRWKCDLCNSIFPHPCPHHCEVFFLHFFQKRGKQQWTMWDLSHSSHERGLLTASSIRFGEERRKEKRNTPSIQTKSKWEP